MAIKATVTNEGLLIPKDVAERALGQSREVEIREEPGRLVIAVASDTVETAVSRTTREDPIVTLGKSPVHTGGLHGSTDHDRYLYVDE